MSLEINKSSRHPKIAGDFGESLVLYWLSKHGFECAKVDHTGIDLIAKNPHTNEVMGISVKSRTRAKGQENTSVNIVTKSGDFLKINAACEAFHCNPYFAIVVDSPDAVRVFIVSKPDLIELSGRKRNCYWRMSPHDLAQYAKHDRIRSFELQIKNGQWW